jgi:large subunit ribosomal protein L5
MRLKEKYTKEVMPALKEKFGYKNDLAVPRITKVVVNTGFNPSNKDEKAQEEIARDLALIAGQKPNPRPAKRSEAGFKIRQGMIIGLAVTLRSQRMYDFLDRLIHIALPRSRDFRGLLEKNIDQAGNLNIGIKEQIIFPEISAEHVKNIFGLEITVVTTAKSREEGVELFKLLGFPIKGLIQRPKS